MSDAVEILHDEIDELEDMREQAKEAVREILTNRLKEALEASRVDGGINVPMALGLLADWVEEELAGRTTDAFERGLAFTARRIEAEE